MIFEIEETGGLPDFFAMQRAQGQMSARILGYLGKEAAVELAGMMERGVKGITFHDMGGNRKSRGGRRMITYSVGRSLKWVKISSFPLNLFEGGRGLRSGAREEARNILRENLKGVMSARMSSAIEGAKKLIVDDWFNENAKGGMKYLQ